MKKRKEKDYFWVNRNWGGKKVYFSDKKQNYVKPSLFWKLLIYGSILLVLIFVILVFYASRLIS